jgi:hypothetical protein
MEERVTRALSGASWQVDGSGFSGDEGELMTCRPKMSYAVQLNPTAIKWGSAKKEKLFGSLLTL